MPARTEKFDPAEQMDQLFHVAPGSGGVARATERRQELRSVAFAPCPKCSAERCGLVVQGTHLAWRLHQVRTWGGASMECRASGQRVCALPPRHDATPRDSQGGLMACKHIDWLTKGTD